MDRAHLRMLPGALGVHVSGTGQRAGVPDRSGVPVGRAGAGKRRHACVHGVQELLRQQWHAGPQRDRPGSTSG